MDPGHDTGRRVLIVRLGSAFRLGDRPGSQGRLGATGAYGNRTHQRRVSMPFTGFEDQAGHQPPKRSPDLNDETHFSHF